MYKTFDELHKAYGIDGESKSRNDFTKEEERSFVNDCFDTYEHIGFADTFDTPYSDNQKYIGKTFSVLGRVKEITEDNADGADLECLPMWNIRFDDGYETIAYPEEICLAEHK